jgi:tetratricopeptide (TPR) repeat protein
MMPDNSDPFETPPASLPGTIVVSPDTARLVESEACSSWTESGVHSPTVSVSRLSVPDKATGEFQKACSAYKDKRLEQAEGHVRKAIDIYPTYAASWVLLGQVLDAEHNRKEADKACSQAITLDPNYVAPYLCLAEFAARDENWQEVSRLSDQALALDPVSNAYALYYSADADFHQQHLAEAESSAREALPLDPWHKLPQLHLLLAHVYAAKGDVHGEAAELKEYLKMASNSADAPAVRAQLKQLDAPPPPKQP